MEIAVKLSQVLWRKTQPDAQRDATSHLHRLIFDALHWEEWEWAIMLGSFGREMAKRGGFNDRERRINVVNLAIASRYKLGADAGIKNYGQRRLELVHAGIYDGRCNSS
jgi:hypothetical protein